MNKLQFQWNVIIFSSIVLMARSPLPRSGLRGNVPLGAQPAARPLPQLGVEGNKPVPRIVLTPPLDWIVPLDKQGSASLPIQVKLRKIHF